MYVTIVLRYLTQIMDMLILAIASFIASNKSRLL